MRGARIDASEPLAESPREREAPEVAAEASTAFWHPFANMAGAKDEEVVIVAGDGCEVVDREGRRYLDATAALWYCNVGYGRAEIAAAAEGQLRALHAYSCFGVYANEPALSLCARLARLVPLPDAKVFLTSGGSDAIETAAKLARRYWDAVGRPEKRIVIGRRFGYHGMHAYGTSLGGIAANVEGIGSLIPDTAHVPHDSVAALAREIERVGAGRVAAFVGEPVIGAGGVIPPPEGYWAGVAEICREHDVLLVSDEVITGFGRLGHWFGAARFGFQPDLLVFAKGVSSGYLPLGGVAVGPRVQEPFWEGDGVWFRHGYTYSGHAAACAAALANLDVVEHERLVERVSELEPVLAELVAPLAGHPLVAEVRSIGLLAAVELASEALERDPLLAERVVVLARERGVLTRTLRGCALQVSPPFTITRAELATIAETLHEALEAARFAAN